MTQFKISDLVMVLPEITIAAFAMLLLIVSTFKCDSCIRKVNNISIIVLIFAAIMLFGSEFPNINFNNDIYIGNNFTLFSKVLIIIGAIFSIFLASGYYTINSKYSVAEYPCLILLSVVGMMIMVSSANFLSLYMGLELQSLPLYILASIHRNNIKSSESGLKYFVLGALASGIMLYGISLIYGFSGTINFSKIVEIYRNTEELPIGVIVGLVLLIVALCFKVSASPFHMWAPDVYEGAPIPVTTFLAVAPKIAAICLFVNILAYPFAKFFVQWQQVIIFVSALSMMVGAFGALRQVNIKRLMAYSSIGHIGYILMGLASTNSDGIQAIMIYITIYMVMTLGIFAAIMIVKEKEEGLEDIYSFSGLAKTKPLLAIVIAIILFSMAGIPPFAGFFAKFYVFVAAIKAGLYPLALLGVVTSVVSTFYYLRIIKIMYFDEAKSTLSRDTAFEMKFVSYFSAIFNVLFFIYFSTIVDITSTVAKVFR